MDISSARNTQKNKRKPSVTTRGSIVGPKGPQIGHKPLPKNSCFFVFWPPPIPPGESRTGSSGPPVEARGRPDSGGAKPLRTAGPAARTALEPHSQGRPSGPPGPSRFCQSSRRSSWKMVKSIGKPTGTATGRFTGTPRRFIVLLQVSKERSPSDPNRLCTENPRGTPENIRENGYEMEFLEAK